MDHEHHMVSSRSTDHRHQHGLRQHSRLQTSTWTGVAVWTTDTSLSPSYSMDHGHQHGGLSRRPSPGNELFSISDILSLLRGGTIVHPGRVFGVEPSQAPGCCRPPCRPSLAIAHSHLSRSISYLFMEAALQTVVCPTVYFLPKYLYMKILIAMSH